MSAPEERVFDLANSVTVDGKDTGLTLGDLLGPGAFLLSCTPEERDVFFNETIDGLEVETGLDLSHARPPTPPQEA